MRSEESAGLSGLVEWVSIVTWARAVGLFVQLNGEGDIMFFDNTSDNGDGEVDVVQLTDAKPCSLLQFHLWV